MSAGSLAKPGSETQKKMIRAGIFTKGALYLLIGALALLNALGQSGGSTEGKRGTVGWLMEQSYGPYLVLAAALGLLFYSAWRIIRAFIDEGEDKGAGKKASLFFGGIMYLALAVYAGVAAVQGLSGGGSSSSSGGSGKKQDIFSQLLDSTWGQVVLGAFAAVILGRAIYYLYMAFSGKFKEKVDNMNTVSDKKSILIKTGYAGYVARAITFMIICYLVVRMIIDHDPSAAGGTGKALEFIQNTGGQIALIVIAFGLACYGFFVILQAKYRQINATV